MSVSLFKAPETIVTALDLIPGDEIAWPTPFGTVPIRVETARESAAHPGTLIVSGLTAAGAFLFRSVPVGASYRRTPVLPAG